MEVSKGNIIDLRKIKPEIKRADPEPACSEPLGPELVAEGPVEAVEGVSIPYSFETLGAKTSTRLIPLVTIGVIGVGLIAYFAVSSNYLASLLFFLAAITVAFGALDRKPKRVKCTMSADGVQINNAFWPYGQLKSFWIFYDPPRHQEVSIKTKGAFAPYLKIPLQDHDPVKIRELLVKFIPEKKQEESLPDVFARMVGL